MSRPKEFDPDLALDRALEVFLEKGFEGTSLNDLVERTGVHRGSLYGTFGNKEQLFLASLRRFHARVGAQVEAAAAHRFRPRPAHGGPDVPPLEFVRCLFRYHVDAYASGTRPGGCLLANTCAEMPADSDAIRSTVHAMLEEREAMFHRLLSRARKRGELPAGRGPRRLAQYLNALALGVALLIRTEPDGRALRSAVDVGLSVLDG